MTNLKWSNLEFVSCQQIVIIMFVHGWVSTHTSTSTSNNNNKHHQWLYNELSNNFLMVHWIPGIMVYVQYCCSHTWWYVKEPCWHIQFTRLPSAFVSWQSTQGIFDSLHKVTHLYNTLWSYYKLQNLVSYYIVPAMACLVFTVVYHKLYNKQPVLHVNNCSVVGFFHCMTSPL